MKLLRLYLKGFKPLSLSNIEEFDYTPEAPWQLILGTNGSGKSSILRAATPTVTDRSEFRPGGIKHTLWELEDGTQYELVSTYERTVKHSFKRNGEELNDGGTGTVQTELVEHHLGYTKALHMLLTQEVRFTEMTKAGREALLLDISGNNFEYALRLFDDLKKSHRDTVGASKHLAVKYSDLCQQLDAMGDMETLAVNLEKEEKEVARLTGFTNWSLPETNPVTAKIEANYRALNAFLEKGERLRKQFKILLSENDIQTSDWESYSKFKEGVISKQQMRNHIDASLKEIETEMSELSGILQRLEDCPESIDADALAKQVSELEDKQRQYVSHVKGTHPSPEQGKQACMSFIHGLTTINDNIPSGLVYYSEEEIRQCMARVTERQAQITETEVKLRRLCEIEHHAKLSSENDVVCPNCDTRILSEHSLDVDRMNELAKRIKMGEAKVAELKNALKKEEGILSQMKGLESLRKQLRELLSRHSNFRPLWEDMGKLDDILRSPLVLLNALSSEHDALELEIGHKASVEHLKKLKEYQYLIALRDGENTQGKLQELQKRYERLIAARNDASHFISLYTKVENVFDSMREVCQQMDTLVAERERLFFEWANAEGTIEVNNYVRSKQTQMGQMRNALTQWKDLESRKDYLATSNEELKDKKQKLETLIKLLSPTTGLIGRHLRASLNDFCDMVNTILAEIWEHELSISVPKEEKKLSFNFNMHVDGEIREDVKRGSKGEQEVINMAITLVIMAQKNLQSYPLFMDEIGASFDHVHRRNLLTFIRKLITGGSINQLLMISHFLSDYGGIGNVDVVALNTNNIQISSAYNEVVTMK